jgi:intracellular sulfur oxidation DsrE/DsrF family protein
VSKGEKSEPAASARVQIEQDTRVERRMMMLGTGGLLAAATAGVAQAATASPVVEAQRWRPQFEAADRWLDLPHTQHRMVFDVLTPKGAMMALEFADNFFAINQSAYGLHASALGVVIVLRHMATPMGYNDRVWKKYGAAFAEKLQLDAKTTMEAEQGNPLDRTSGGPSGKGHSPTLASLAKMGVRFAICGMATTGIAGMVAKLVGGHSEQVHHEFAMNLIDNALMVPAGIVAVNRAQEHGYTLAYVG